MRYRLISVGKIREKFYAQGIEEYIKRLRAYTNIELIDGLEEKISPRATEKEIIKALEKEAERILNYCGENDILVVLDVNGKVLSSEELANQLEQWNRSGKPNINIIVGSANGVSEILKRQAHLRISFSKMTFPHQMAVLILVEQVYRGFKILKGEPYHK